MMYTCSFFSHIVSTEEDVAWFYVHYLLKQINSNKFNDDKKRYCNRFILFTDYLCYCTCYNHLKLTFFIGFEQGHLIRSAFYDILYTFLLPLQVYFPPRQQLIHEAKPREIVAVEWDKTLAIARIVSKYVFY